MAEGSLSYGDEKIREVTEEIEEIEETQKVQVASVDWSKKADVQREMRRLIKRRLPSELFSAEAKEQLAAMLIDLLKAWKGR